METKFPICKYCNQNFNKKDDMVLIMSKKYVKKTKWGIQGYESEIVRKYHKRCWNKIERKVEKIEDGN